MRQFLIFNPEVNSKARESETKITGPWKSNWRLRELDVSCVNIHHIHDVTNTRIISLWKQPKTGASREMTQEHSMWGRDLKAERLWGRELWGLPEITGRGLDLGDPTHVITQLPSVTITQIEFYHVHIFGILISQRVCALFKIISFTLKSVSWQGKTVSGKSSLRLLTFHFLYVKI